MKRSCDARIFCLYFFAGHVLYKPKSYGLTIFIQKQFVRLSNLRLDVHGGNFSMTDVFIRVFSSSELRLGFAIATVARWKMQKDVRVRVIQLRDGIPYEFADDSVSLRNEEIPFATSSLQHAEIFAQSDPYIICNDDNLPYGQDFVSEGLRVMQENPEFGCVSGIVVNGDPYPKDGPEVQELHAVGGLVFLRKGLVTKFEPMEDAFWDGYRHAQVEARGFKSGWSRCLPYLHMGARFSVANPAHFNGA